jgi:hypothetical protein
MAKKITPLSEAKVRTCKPQAHPYKLFDGGGLFLLVTPSGGKLWNFKYRFEGKEKKLALGTYPEISLSDARLRREEVTNDRLKRQRVILNALDADEAGAKESWGFWIAS